MHKPIYMIDMYPFLEKEPPKRNIEEKIWQPIPKYFACVFFVRYLHRTAKALLFIRVRSFVCLTIRNIMENA